MKYENERIWKKISGNGSHHESSSKLYLLVNIVLNLIPLTGIM